VTTRHADNHNAGQAHVDLAGPRHHGRPPDGFLGYVQKVGDRPESSQLVTYDSTADFGVGACLLGGTDLARLCR